MSLIKKKIMKKTSEILKLISLAILFGGSASVVFVAIVLVKAAKANGVPVEEAAFRNAPAFIYFGKVAAGAAIVLLIAEGTNYALHLKESIKLSKAKILGYFSSLLCALTALVFAFGITPPMEKILPDLKTDKAAHDKFHQLHETSRAVFGASIVFALVSLLLSTCQSTKQD